MSRNNPTNWTVDEDGRSNSSPLFCDIVTDIAQMISNIRVGDDPRSAARLIVAQLAHIHHLAPTRSPDRKSESRSDEARHE